MENCPAQPDLRQTKGSWLVNNEFAAKVLVEGDGGQDVGDFLGRSTGAVDVFPGEAEGTAVVPDFFEYAADGGGAGGDVDHVLVALAALLAVADVDDRRAEAGGFDDSGGGVAGEDGGTRESSEIGGAGEG